jgi:hypothetical protein
MEDIIEYAKFPKQKLTRIIVACMALHNLIRDNKIMDIYFV